MVYTRADAHASSSRKKIIMSTSQPSQETAGTGSSASARADPPDARVPTRRPVDVFYRMAATMARTFPSLPLPAPRPLAADGWMSAPSKRTGRRHRAAATAAVAAARKCRRHAFGSVTRIRTGAIVA